MVGGVQADGPILSGWVCSDCGDAGGSMDDWITHLRSCKPEPDDPVTSPPHYTQGGTEAIDHILDIVATYPDPVDAYLVGQVLKYLIRAPHKGQTVQDLAKAGWYLAKLTEKQNDE